MYPERVILNNCTEFILVLVFSIILVFLLAGHGTKGLYQIKAKLWGFVVLAVKLMNVLHNHRL